MQPRSGTASGQHSQLPFPPVQQNCFIDCAYCVCPVQLAHSIIHYTDAVLLLHKHTPYSRHMCLSMLMPGQPTPYATDLSISLLTRRLWPACLLVYSVQESGTAAHALRLTTSPVPGLQSLPGGGRLYVTPSLTQQQLSQLAQALQALYAHDTQQFSTPEALHGPAAASTASVAAAAAGCGRQPAAKCPRVEQQRQQEQQSLSSGASKLTLILICQLGSQVHMSVKPSTQLHKVFNAYAECKLVPPEELRFMYKGNRVHGDSNPLELGMVTGDVIECRLQQAGC